MSNMQRDVFFSHVSTSFCLVFPPSLKSICMHSYLFLEVYIFPLPIYMQYSTNWTNVAVDMETYTIMHISQAKTATPVPAGIILSPREAQWLMLNIFMQCILMLHTHTFSTTAGSAREEKRK